MKNRRKSVVLASVIIIVSFLAGTAVFAAAPEGNVLDELWEAIFGIQDDVEDLQTQIDLQAQIAELETEIAQLQAQMEFLEDPWIVGPQGETGPEGPQGETGPQGGTGPQGPAGGFGAPDYDSGWISLTTIVDVNHNLGTNNIFVYLVGRKYDYVEFEWVYHQDNLGGEIFIDGAETFTKGVDWRTIDENTLQVYRYTDDVMWEEFRLRIWVIS